MKRLKITLAFKDERLQLITVIEQMMNLLKDENISLTILGDDEEYLKKKGTLASYRELINADENIIEKVHQINSDVVLLFGENLVKEFLEGKRYQNIIPYIAPMTKDQIKQDIDSIKEILDKFPFILTNVEMKLRLVNEIPDYKNTILALPDIYVFDQANKNLSIDLGGALLPEEHRTIPKKVSVDLYNNSDHTNRIIDFLTKNRGISRLNQRVQFEVKLEDINLIKSFKKINSDISFTARENDFFTEGDIFILDSPEGLSPIDIKEKLISYAFLGRPIILYKHPVYEDLLGEHYPLYYKNNKQIYKLLNQLIEDERFYNQCCNHVRQFSNFYNFSQVKNQILPVLWRFNNDPTTILFAGHDFKFLNQYIQSCKEKNLNVIVDQWKGHTKHDAEQSERKLREADIVFCEWGLGNAIYYSQNKLKHQKLYIRVHRQELTTKNFNQIDLEKVDRIIAVSPFILEEFSRIKNIPRAKMTLIPNYINVEHFRTKTNSSERSKFHLGLLGILPKLKRLDRALDLFEQLWRLDSRYKLYIKGKRPEELGWLQNRKKEVEYYEQLFKKINEAPWNNNVIFEEYNHDVASWFSKIGYILSTSDIEAFHLAIVEGMASGVQPVVFNWPGAKYIYPKDIIVNSVQEAKELIIYNNKSNRSNHQFEEFVSQYDKKIIFERLDQLLELKSFSKEKR
mgnify:CR=1 FL=1